jgi:hypothetical protein
MPYVVAGNYHLISPGGIDCKMATRNPRWWQGRLCGCVSVGICFAEILIVVGAGVLIHTPGTHNTHIISKVTSATFLVGTLGSFAFAIAGLIVDSRRFTAFVALVVSAATFIIGGLLLMT